MNDPPPYPLNETPRDELSRLRALEARLRRTNPILFAMPGSAWYLVLTVDRLSVSVPLQIVENTSTGVTFITHDMFHEAHCDNPCTRTGECTFRISKDSLCTMSATEMENDEWVELFQPHCI